MLKFEKADKQEVTKCSKAEKDVKRTLGQKTEDRLMKYILDKPVKIGERIPTEGELTELFEVGRSTVRKAVKGLVTRSVLEVRRGDGTYVIRTIYMENDGLGLETWRNVIGWHWICLMYV